MKVSTVDVEARADSSGRTHPRVARADLNHWYKSNDFYQKNHLIYKPAKAVRILVIENIIHFEFWFQWQADMFSYTSYTSNVVAKR